MPLEFTDADAHQDWFHSRDISYHMDVPPGPVHHVFVECELPDVMIGRGWGSALKLDRTDRQVRQGSVDDITLAIQLGSSTRLIQDGRETVTTKGGGNFYSSTRPMRFEQGDDNDMVMVMVQRRHLRQITGLDIPLGLQVDPGNIGLGILSDTAARLLTVAESMPAQERVHYARALTDMLAAVVLSTHSGERLQPSGPEALLEQLKADIFARLDDPDLGPADLAARHNISLRYVHRLFGEEAPAAFHPPAPDGHGGRPARPDCGRAAADLQRRRPVGLPRRRDVRASLPPALRLHADRVPLDQADRGGRADTDRTTA